MIVPNLPKSLDWYLKLTDMRPLTLSGPTRILRVGNGPHFIAMSEGSGPEAFKPHVGFGVQRFNADQVMARLAEHGVNARKNEPDGVTAILLDSPDGIEIELQDLSDCGARSC